MFAFFPRKKAKRHALVFLPTIGSQHACGFVPQHTGAMQADGIAALRRREKHPCFLHARDLPRIGLGFLVDTLGDAQLQTGKPAPTPPSIAGMLFACQDDSS